VRNSLQEQSSRKIVFIAIQNNRRDQNLITTAVSDKSEIEPHMRGVAGTVLSGFGTRLAGAGTLPQGTVGALL